MHITKVGNNIYNLWNSTLNNHYSFSLSKKIAMRILLIISVSALCFVYYRNYKSKLHKNNLKTTPEKKFALSKNNSTSNLFPYKDERRIELAIKIDPSIESNRSLALVEKEKFALTFIKNETNSIVDKSHQIPTRGKGWQRLIHKIHQLSKIFGKGVAKGEFSLNIRSYAVEFLTSTHVHPFDCDELVKEWQKTVTDHSDFIRYVEENIQSGKLLGKGVVYLSPEELESYKICSSGGIVTNHAGHDFVDDTPLAVVVGLNNNMYIGTKCTGVFNHSSFFHGKPVKAATIIYLNKGSIVEIQAYSGHYHHNIETEKWRADIYSILKTIQILLRNKIKLRANILLTKNSFRKEIDMPIKDFYKLHRFNGAIFNGISDEEIQSLLQDEVVGSWLIRSEINFIANSSRTSKTYFVSKLMGENEIWNFELTDELWEDLNAKHGYKNKDETNLQILPDKF